MHKTYKHRADPNLPGLALGLVQGGLSLKSMVPSPLSLNLSCDVSWNIYTQPYICNMST